jgi:hypothetical protein
VCRHGERREESAVCIVFANEVKQSSERVCTWIASGCAFAMTMKVQAISILFHALGNSKIFMYF